MRLADGGRRLHHSPISGASFIGIPSLIYILIVAAARFFEAIRQGGIVVIGDLSSGIL